MSWLYDHRHQMDGLCHLIEIAHWTVKPLVPPEDRDDVEQEIVISLIQTVEKYGKKVGIDVLNLSPKGKSYLYKVARHRRSDYFGKKYEERRLWHIEETDYGEIAGVTHLASHDKDLDARLDAIAILATLPKRLIQIGYKIMDTEWGEQKLSVADMGYWLRERDKLLSLNIMRGQNFRRYTKHLSELEKSRILKMYSEGISVTRIAKALGRNYLTVRPVLPDSQLSPRQRIEIAAKERDDQIRHAYFVDGKALKQIEREFHYGSWTVRSAVGLDTRGSKPRLKSAEAKEKDKRIRHAYFVDEKNISQIAREFNCDRHTVRRAIKTERSKTGAEEDKARKEVVCNSDL